MEKTFSNTPEAKMIKKFQKCSQKLAQIEQISPNFSSLSKEAWSCY